MYKNELLSFQQKRNLAKSKRKIFLKKSCWVLFTKLFIYWLPRHSVFWFTLAQSVRSPLVTYPSLWSTCMTYTTSCYAIGHQTFPTQPLPRQVEDFPRGGSHSKHMPLLTCFAWLQPICYNPKFEKVLLVVKSLITNFEQQAH